MKIIIAPAKVMKTKYVKIEQTELLFVKKTKQLHNYLKKYSIDELHDNMKISFKMAKTVYNYYHDDYNRTPAIYCYQGTVLKQVNLNTYQDEDFDYLNKYLNIMSAYYGILKYNTGITPYRLDMIMKFDLDLYDFWQKDVNNYFKDEDYLICLASKEFAKMINHPNLINIDFVEDKAGKLVRNSMYIKQARGKMLDIMVKNKIISLEELKRVTFDDYYYNDDLSTNDNYVFMRNAKQHYKKL
ncbi:YaaA family protein [Thomasclavelia sp.]